jgi:phytoene dehydrogenase-like protein
MGKTSEECVTNLTPFSSSFATKDKEHQYTKGIENMNTEQLTVAIVGGGLSGLSAATYLARAGVQVTLFEKAAHPGGRAASQRYQGYSLNRGSHAFYSGGSASEVLRELNITYPYSSPAAGDLFLLEQGRFEPFPATAGTMVRTKALDLLDKLELMRVLATFSTAGTAHISVQEWIQQSFRRPQNRYLIAAIARTYTYSDALDLVSAEVFIDKLRRSLFHPVHYIQHGWQTLVDALQAQAERYGAQIKSGTRVTGLVREGNRVQGVRLSDGRVFSADAVIVATTPKEAARIIDVPSFQTLADSLLPARLATVEVALSRQPVQEHTIVQSLDHPVFMSVQSHYTEVAPKGAALITAFKQLSPIKATDPEQDLQDLEAVLDAAQPGWREVQVKKIYLPHIETVGTLPLARSGGFAGRPDYRLPELTNLYLAGDWVGSEGFATDASLASARRVSRLILQAGSSLYAEQRQLSLAR